MVSVLCQFSDVIVQRRLELREKYREQMLLARSAPVALRSLRVSGSRRYASTTGASSISHKGFAVNTIGVFGAACLGYAVYETFGKDKRIVSAESSAALTNPEQWVEFRLAKITEVNHNTKKFEFTFDSPDQVLGIKTNGAILTKYQGPKDEKPTVRPYTPVSDPDQRGSFELLIKKYPNGPMSSHLHSMNVNQMLSVRGPIPKYAWEPNKHEHVGLIAGGTGITPMYQLIKTILKNPEDKTKITLVYGSVSEDDILLKHELEEFENSNPNQFKVFYVIDKPIKSWVGPSGYINKELVTKVMPQATGGKNLKLFICGPPGMYKVFIYLKQKIANRIRQSAE